MSIFDAQPDTRTEYEKAGDRIETSIINQAAQIVRTYRINARALLTSRDPQAILNRWGTKAQAILEAATMIVGYVAPDELLDMPPHTKNQDGSITLDPVSSSESESFTSEESAHGSV